MLALRGGTLSLFNVVIFLLLFVGLAGVWLRMVEFVLSCYDLWRDGR